jgi:AraC-like DNA-binding protein
MLQEMGMTPKQFLIAARIEKAQELLLKPGSSVLNVALEVGYSSMSQFIAAFRSQTGQLPSEVARIGRKPKV